MAPLVCLLNTFALKAMCGLEHGKICFPDPMVPDDEGLKLLPYEPADDEFCYTKDGEKVCAPRTVSFREPMLGELLASGRVQRNLVCSLGYDVGAFGSRYNS